MGTLFIIMAIVAVVVCLSYILYINGFAVVNTKSVLFYMGVPRFGKRRKCIEAKFLSCNGVIKRVICLSKSKRYRFVFSSNTTEGSVYVEIYGKGKEIIAKLNDEQPCALISTEKRTHYRVISRFENADGQYKLIWDEV